LVSGCGGWGAGSRPQTPNPQTPIPNPQSPKNIFFILKENKLN